MIDYTKKHSSDLSSENSPIKNMQNKIVKSVKKGHDINQIAHNTASKNLDQELLKSLRELTVERIYILLKDNLEKRMDQL